MCVGPTSELVTKSLDQNEGRHSLYSGSPPPPWALTISVQHHHQKICFHLMLVLGASCAPFLQLGTSSLSLASLPWCIVVVPVLAFEALFDFGQNQPDVRPCFFRQRIQTKNIPRRGMLRSQCSSWSHRTFGAKHWHLS